MHNEIVTYEADGLTMQSRLYQDVGDGRRPAILVFPDAFGLGEQAMLRAERLAGLGYVALACDVHGDGKVVRDLETAMGLIGPLNSSPDRLRARAIGGLKALIARHDVDADRIAAIGYCFGGTMALELARGGAGIAGVVGFHCGLSTSAPGDAARIKGKILVCLGADDPIVDAAQRQAFEVEMHAGKVNWQMNLYGGVVHNFTNPHADRAGQDFVRYDPQADARSWAEMRAFLDEIFASAST